MLKRLLRLALRLFYSSLLGVILIYASIRLLGFDLSFPRENQSLPIATKVPSHDYTKYPFVPGTMAKNVIMFNIAGMGINQVLATRYKYYGKDGRLNMERMPVVSLVNNSPLGPPLTTSPHAAAAAMAKGHKAYNGRLAPPEEEDQEPLLKLLKRSGYKTGIITNSYITGASTAAFSTDVEYRSEQREIAKQMILNQYDFMVGGGNEFYKSGFDINDVTGTVYAEANGYRVITTKQELFQARDSLILGLFDDLYSDRYAVDVSFDPEKPTMQELVDVALQNLDKSSRGFFLLVDDEGTDYGGYRNRSDYLIQHLWRMDQAVGTAIEFALEDRQTLVLVVSEAEAGGMIVTGGDADKGIMTFSWGSDRHTAQMVPLFVFGPGAINFSGIIENTEIHSRVLDVLGQLE